MLNHAEQRYDPALHSQQQNLKLPRRFDNLFVAAASVLPSV